MNSSVLWVWASFDKFFYQSRGKSEGEREREREKDTKRLSEVDDGANSIPTFLQPILVNQCNMSDLTPVEW